LGDRPKDDKRRRPIGHIVSTRRTHLALPAILLLLLMQSATSWAGQAQPPHPEPQLPEAPQPQIVLKEKSKMGPCRVVPKGEPAGEAATGTASATSSATTSVPPPQDAAKTDQADAQAQLPPCPPQPLIDWFARFINGPEVKPLTPKEKARLAVRNLLDPFNGITILGTAAVSVGSDAHSPYGPGMAGFGRYVGVSFTQDMTGELFGTFLIPSVVHQDPHYHRMPNGSIPRRVGHAIFQVVWTLGDNGKGMLNYSNLVGFAIEDEISNLYVPDRHTNMPASAARYGIGLATAPTDNFITEFLPDVARRIHVRVVLVQRIINQVAKTDGPGSP